MDQEYAAIAEHESDLDDVAEQLAYDNFLDNGCWVDVAEEEGYDPDEMNEDDWDTLYNQVDESAYYSFCIDEFLGTEEEWNEYAKDGIYSKNGFV